jgi:hypothetical protein
MRLVVNKFNPDDPNDEWYVIERAEHDGRRWDEPLPDGHGTRLLKSSRVVSDLASDVKGTTREMRAIAINIRARRTMSFARCAVDARREPVTFWSPRNSNGAVGECTRAEANALAKQIEEMLGTA